MMWFHYYASLITIRNIRDLFDQRFVFICIF